MVAWSEWSECSQSRNTQHQVAQPDSNRYRGLHMRVSSLHLGMPGGGISGNGTRTSDEWQMAQGVFVPYCQNSRPLGAQSVVPHHQSIKVPRVVWTVLDRRRRRHSQPKSLIAVASGCMTNWDGRTWSVWRAGVVRMPAWVAWEAWADLRASL